MRVLTGLSSQEMRRKGSLFTLPLLFLSSLLSSLISWKSQQNKSIAKDVDFEAFKFETQGVILVVKPGSRPC